MAYQITKHKLLFYVSICIVLSTHTLCTEFRVFDVNEYFSQSQYVLDDEIGEGSVAYTTDGAVKEETFADSQWMKLIYLIGSLFLVLFAGLMSGLTLGLMSLDMTNLKIIANSGDPAQQKYAKKIMPLIKHHHLLLVTLLTANAIAMEALPLFLDRIVGPILAIVLSVTLILFFGEIIPQAVCTRYGLAIGANLAWLVWFLIFVFFIISYPLGKLLDCILGHDSGTFYRRAELKELVGIHEYNSDLHEEGAERLTQDEVNIIKGAIDLSGKTAASAMTPIERVSSLEFNDLLDMKTCERLVQEGHSRWPVYRGDKNNIIGMLLVKSLVLIDPKAGTPVRNLNLRRLPVVSENMPLYQVLDMFQQGKSHMALVIDSVDCITTKGIITLEDVVEELIGEEILDETDVFEDVAKQVRVVRAFKNEIRLSASGGGSSASVRKPSKPRMQSFSSSSQLLEAANTAGHSEKDSLINQSNY